MENQKEAARRSDELKRLHEEGKITLNEMRIAMGFEPIDEPEFEQLVKKA